MNKNVSDAFSKEMSEAGLPKSCKVIAAATSLGAFAADTVLLYDKIAYNYSGYTFTMAGGFLNGIIVPEPGIYRCGLQIATLANTQTTRSGIYQNGNLIWRDGAFHMNGQGQVHGTGGTVAEQTWAEGELNQGDIISGFLGNPVGGPFNTTIGGVWLCITKLGGRY